MAHHGFGKAVKEQALRDYNYCCAACGMADQDLLQYDHVTPRKAGGDSTLANCQILCAACNNAKNGLEGLAKMAPRQPIYDSRETMRVRREYKLKLDAIREAMKGAA